MLYALALSTLAGLSTGLGGALAALGGRPTPRRMAAALGFAAGVMLTVSLSQMLPYAAAQYARAGLAPARAGALCAALCVCGQLAGAALERLVPEPRFALRGEKGGAARKASARAALATAAAVTAHNLPEGVLTVTAAADAALALPVALAVALHNIPEGLAVAAAVLAAGGSRRRAFWTALLSGLAEPLGALCAALALRRAPGPLGIAGTMAFIAGVMVWVCAAQLLAQGYAGGEERRAAAGVCAGAAVMTAALALA